MSISSGDILNMPAGRKMDALIWKHVYKSEHPKPPVNDFPSTDIACAFELLKKFDAYVIERVFSQGDWRGHACWLAKGDSDEHVEGEARAETIPLAICRAALLCVSSETS
jgi:hypothetical protein